MKPASRAQIANAFSLVEVALAVGIIGFCLIGVIGLLPVGLSTHQSAEEEARAASALNMVNSAAKSLRPYNPHLGNMTWAFPSYFSDNPTGTPTIVWVAQTDWAFTFFVSEGGTIIPNSDTTTPKRQTLYVHVYPPQTDSQAVGIYAAVAWPYKPSDNVGTAPSQMTGRQGFVDTYVAYAANPSY